MHLLLKNKKILELGSGTGFVGLVCSYFQPDKIYLTDLEDHVLSIKKILILIIIFCLMKLK